MINDMVVLFTGGNNSISGGYAICLDNTPAFVAKKLVHVYIATFVDEEWVQYKQEIEGLKMTVGNFSVSHSQLPPLLPKI